MKKPTPPPTQKIKEGEDPNKKKLLKFDHNVINDNTSFMPPKLVGSYKIGENDNNYHFYFSKKPKWFHRKMMKWCFGFEWVDNQ